MDDNYFCRSCCLIYECYPTAQRDCYRASSHTRRAWSCRRMRPVLLSRCSGSRRARLGSEPTRRGSRAVVPAVGDEVDLQVPREWLVPVRERADRDTASDRRLSPSWLPPFHPCAGFGQDAIDRRRACCENAGSNVVIQPQMTVAFESGEQHGQQRLQTLPADPVGSFPEDDKRLTSSLLLQRPLLADPPFDVRVTHL